MFNSLFVHIDRLWSQRKAVRSDFAAIIGAATFYRISITCVYTCNACMLCMYDVGEVKASLVRILKRGPKTIQDFKSISQEEGVTIAD